MEAKTELKKMAENYTQFIQGIIEKQQMLNVPFPINIDITKINEFTSVNDSITTNIIYIITTENIPDNIKKLYARGRENGWSISQYNEYRECGYFSGEKCIYVGSCSKEGINTRLRQHIGLSNSKGTSSLHLKHWWTDAKIKIYLFKFNNIVNSDDLQSIEDIVWDTCKPFLGKKGPRSRKFEKDNKKPR